MESLSCHTHIHVYTYAYTYTCICMLSICMYIHLYNINILVPKEGKEVHHISWTRILLSHLMWVWGTKLECPTDAMLLSQFCSSQRYHYNSENEYSPLLHPHHLEVMKVPATCSVTNWMNLMLLWADSVHRLF